MADFYPRPPPPSYTQAVDPPKPRVPVRESRQRRCLSLDGFRGHPVKAVAFLVVLAALAASVSSLTSRLLGLSYRAMDNPTILFRLGKNYTMLPDPTAYIDDNVVLQSVSASVSVATALAAVVLITWVHMKRPLVISRAVYISILALLSAVALLALAAAAYTIVVHEQSAKFNKPSVRNLPSETRWVPRVPNLFQFDPAMSGQGPFSHEGWSCAAVEILIGLPPRSDRPRSKLPQVCLAERVYRISAVISALLLCGLVLVTLMDRKKGDVFAVGHRGSGKETGRSIVADDLEASEESVVR